MGKKNRHHVRPQSRGGTWNPANIIVKDITEHASYHQLFGNMTVEEIICCILMEWTTEEWRDQFRQNYDARLSRVEQLVLPVTWRD